MKNNNLVLIADNTKDFGYICSGVLEDSGLQTRLSNKNGRDLIDNILKYEPNVVVTDLFLPAVDALGVVQYINNSERCPVKPKFIIMSGFDNEELQKEIMEAGASYYFLKPFDFDVLAERIHKILNTNMIVKPNIQYNAHQPELQINSHSDLEILVTDIIHEIGVPANVKGYHYLRDAIMLSIQNPDVLSSITKVLYPSVAERFDTTASRVERAIRHGIERAWNQGELMGEIKDIYGFKINYDNAKPTNSELIATISDKIRLEMRKQKSPNLQVV